MANDVQTAGLKASVSVSGKPPVAGESLNDDSGRSALLPPARQDRSSAGYESEDDSDSGFEQVSNEAESEFEEVTGSDD